MENPAKDKEVQEDECKYALIKETFDEIVLDIAEYLHCYTKCSLTSANANSEVKSGHSSIASPFEVITTIDDVVLLGDDEEHAQTRFLTKITTKITTLDLQLAEYLLFLQDCLSDDTDLEDNCHQVF